MSQENDPKIWLDEVEINGGIVKSAAKRQEEGVKSDQVRCEISEAVHRIDEAVGPLFPGDRLLRDDELVKQDEARFFEVRKIWKNGRGQVFLNLICLELDEKGQNKRIFRTYPASQCKKVLPN